MADYTTGIGQTICNVHDPEACAGHHCVIHNPSDHSMRAFPTYWRADRRLMERICPHGIGHPDPDDLAHKTRGMSEQSARYESSHSCDGCCGDED